MDLPTLLFVDVTCPRPYDPSNIDKPGGVGGTEQTLVQIAEALGETKLFNVVVEQHNRLECEEYLGKAKYTSRGKTPDAKWVIVLRDPRPMVEERKRFPNAKIYLYSHDLADRNLGICYKEGFFKDSGCLANICVSQWHKSQSIDTLRSFGYTGEFRTKFIYNPLPDYVCREPCEYDKNKLLWLASPHKGLQHAYIIFKQLVRLNPKFRFYVTNPGYLEDQHTNDEQIKDKVTILGCIPHRDTVSHLRSSLCLFYPNTVFPETFGKIMAEANAVGTPVITSALGASKEVLDSHPGQIADCRNIETVVKRVMKWWEGERPIVRGNPKFKLFNVVKEWERLLLDIR